MAQAPTNIVSILAAKGSAPAAEQAGERDPALDLLVARLAEIERVQKLQALELNAAKEEAGQYKAMYQQLAAEKAVAEEGMKAAMLELQKLREAQPVSPAEREKLTRALADEALKNIKQKALRFKGALATMPKGTVYNPGEFPIPLTINGVTAWVNPGSSQLPKPFVDAWEAHLESERVASGFARSVHGSVPFGTLEGLIWEERSSGEPVTWESAALQSPSPRAWDENEGQI